MTEEIETRAESAEVEIRRELAGESGAIERAVASVFSGGAWKYADPRGSNQCGKSAGGRYLKIQPYEL